MRPIQRMPLTESQEKGCLQVNPFDMDFGSPGDRVFSDRVCIARKGGICHDCAQPIFAGEQQRRHVALYDNQMRAYRWCYLCCAAMAESWRDGGRALEDRWALRYGVPTEKFLYKDKKCS